MNEIEKLKEQIARELPDTAMILEAPFPPRPNAAWWLNIDLKGHDVAVEWKPQRGFGVVSPAAGAEGADEVYYDVASTAQRVVQLLRGGDHTHPPTEAALAQLRQGLAFSQEELAAALNVRQATVSKWERRSDMHVSTLRKAIAAMGGRLELVAHFPDRVVLIDQVGEIASQGTKAKG